MTDFLMEKIVLPASVILMALMVTVLPALFLYKAFFDPYITLSKEEWECSKTKKEMVLGGVIVGNVIIPNTTSRNVCIEYQKNK